MSHIARRSNRKYHVLAIRQEGTFCVEFGDYEKAVVVQERRDARDSHSWQGLRATDFVVLSVDGDSTADIDAAIAALNAR